MKSLVAGAKAGRDEVRVFNSSSSPGDAEFCERGGAARRPSFPQYWPFTQTAAHGFPASGFQDMMLKTTVVRSRSSPRVCARSWRPSAVDRDPFSDNSFGCKLGRGSGLDARISPHRGCCQASPPHCRVRNDFRNIGNC